MKANRLFLIASTLLLVVTVSGCQLIPFKQTAEAQSVTTADVTRGKLEINVTASGNITLPQITKLGFSGAVSGSQAGNAILSELNVRMGSAVTKGQVIARLDTSAQERDLLRLQNNLDAAALALQKAKEPLYKAEEITKAEASLVVAKSNLEYAREALKKAQNPYTENDFAKAEAAVRNARADLRNAQTAVVKAEEDQQLTKKKNELAIQDAINNAVALENPFSKTSKPTDFDVQKANEALALARRQADSDLAAGNNAIARARDAVAAAESTLASAEFVLSDMLSKKNGDPLDVKQKENAVVSALAAVTNAEKTLALMKQPPDALDIKLKEIQLAAAQLQVDDAKLQLEKSTITAPFDGVIGDFKAKVGDAIAPGSFSIPIVDTTQARVDAFIEEYDVNSVRLVMPATITIDALRGQTFNGTVEAISPLSTVQQGIVRYAVTIKIQTGGPAPTEVGAPRPGGPPGTPGQRPAAGPGQPSATRNPDRNVSSGISDLKDGMSATARIIINQKDDVLLVPNRALMFQSGVQKVQVPTNGQVQDRVVKVGLANDQYTEIVEGVSQGDKVAIQTAAAPQQSSGPPPGAGGLFGGPPQMKIR